MQKNLISALALLACSVATSVFATPGMVLRDEKLYSQPSATASVAASVPKGAGVTILAKQGGWLQVSAGQSTGWIRLLSVRVGSGGLSGAGLGDVVGAATTRSDPSRVVAVAGLRGLNDEDLKQARFNADELKRLGALKVTAAQARNHATRSGLVAANVADLPEPRSAQSSSSWENN